MSKKQYLIGEKFKGFYKLTFENGKFEYINERKLDLLKKDKNVNITKLEEVKIEVKSDKDSSNANTQDLSKYSEKDLVELAKRLGLATANDKMTKKQLIEYIAEKDKK